MSTAPRLPADRWAPLTPEALAEALAELILDAAPPDQPARVLLDGPRSAAPDVLAEAVAPLLRIAGRSVLSIAADGFWRDASVRLEHGREDEESYYGGWADLGALRREVLDPLGPGGSRAVLPSLRDPVSNRATRATAQQCPDATTLILYGDLLLGAGLPAELEIHLAQSAAARARRIPAQWSWILPVYERYDEDVEPAALADAVIRMDDPARPAARIARRITEGRNADGR